VEKPKCKNFETCGNYTNSEHSKWCYPCSLRWNFKQSGYEVGFNLSNNGEIIGIVLIREDIYKKQLMEKQRC
jgi:hypothetical protein